MTEPCPLLLSHLAAGEDIHTAGTLIIKDTLYEFFVVRLFHSLHYILQGVTDVRLLEQGQDELAAAPAWQVVQCKQTPAHPLRSTSKHNKGLFVRQLKKYHTPKVYGHVMQSSATWNNLFIRMFVINWWLRLVGPDSLVEGFQERALKMRQSALYFSAALPQSLLTPGNIPEAQRVEFSHLHTEMQRGGKLQPKHL